MMLAPDTTDKQPTLETERLWLVPPSLEHIPAMVKAYQASKDDLRRRLPWANGPLDEKKARGFIEKAINDTNDIFFPHTKDGNVLLGSFGLHDGNAREVTSYEIGYWLRSDYHRKGFTTEAVLAIADYAFDVKKADRVFIKAFADNVASCGVAKKCGFTYEGIMRNGAMDPLTGKPADIECFSLTPMDRK